ncbi:MAG: asparaginase [Actinomyces sp.]|nr:MAG: asparaginase [Actinomyces sp.]
MRHATGPATSPLRVEVTRGVFVESGHLVTWVLTDTDGAVLAAAGDPDTLVPPRSAMKSLQAFALVAEGAADAHGVADHELALACASHSGEDGHVEAVGAWLERLGLGPDDLGCGPAWPLDADAARRLAARGGGPTRVHHNCSGKHAGFLTLARHLGVSPRGYLDPDHPVQQRVLATVADLTGAAVDRGPVAVDGCGAPVVALPLRALARGVARLAAAGPDEPGRRLVDAMVAHPWYVAGTGRLDTRLLVALDGAGFTKVGAEGNMVAGLDDGTALALKVHDGAGRAAGVALVHLLVALGRLDPGTVIDAPERGTGDAVTVADLVQAPVTNAAGDVVGVVRVAAQAAERMAAATSPHRS